MTTRLAVAAAVLILLSAWTHARSSAANVPFDFAGTVPLVLEEWVGRDAPPLDPDVARVLAADQYVHRYYGPRIPDSESRIEADIAYYVQPEAGAAMHSPLNCLPGNGWQVIDSRPASVSVDGGTAVIRRLVVARGADRVAMTYWFQNRGAVVGNEYRQRVELLKNGLHGRPTDAALVRVMSLDTAKGHDALDRFTRALLPLLNAAFR
jgi:EpsI family protein